MEQAWNDEIARRVSKVKSGNATLLSREEFRSKMRARLDQ
ncbi:MAG TPA: addiction module protein [Marinobacter sp.]|nr:addiction module protein [Marinobacter sp.]